MAEEKCICIVDMGNSHISAAIGQIQKDGSIKVIALRQEKSKGLERGRIVDMGQLIKALKKLLSHVENSADKRLHGTWLCLSNAFLKSKNESGAVSVSNNEVSTSDMTFALALAKEKVLPSSYYLADHFLQGVAVNHTVGNMVKSAISLSADHIQAYYHLMMLPTETLQNMDNALRRANNTIAERNIISSVASSEYALLPEDKKYGVCMVDIGADTTSIAVYAEDKLLLTSCLPIGGNDVTNDIVKELCITKEAAEHVKIHKGCVNISDINLAKMLKIPTGLGTDHMMVSEAELTNIIETRYKEILTKVLSVIEEQGLMYVLTRGIVYCGGGVEIQNFIRFACKQTQKNARKVTPSKALVFADELKFKATQYQYQTVLGGLLHSQSEHAALSQPEHKAHDYKNFILNLFRVKTWGGN